MKRLLLIAFLLLPLPAMSAPKFHIQYENQFGQFRHYQTKHNEADARRVMKRRAESTGKRHRLVDDNGNLVDLYAP